MTFPADTFEEAVDLSITASNQLHTILNGDSTTEVAVEDGSKIPSVRKAYTDSLFFLSPQPWTVGEYETVYNQLRAFVEPTGITTWWFSKPAAVSTPILMSTTPHEDSNWTLWNAINNSVYETQKRLAAEAGLNMVGSFLLGATVTTTNDVVFYETDGKYYGWWGTLPKVVPAGVDPAGTGGVTAGAWVDRSDVTLRDELKSSYGASNVGTDGGLTVQETLDNLIASQNSGVIVFQTYALLDAYTPANATEEKGSFKVTNDPDSSKNGYYAWVSGTSYIKDADLVVNDIDPENTSDAVSGGAVSIHVVRKSAVVQDELTPFSTSDGVHVNYAGGKWGSALYKIEKYNVVSGNTYIVRGLSTSINNVNGMGSYAFYASDNVGSYIAGSVEVLAGYTSKDYANEIVAPVGATVMYVSVKKGIDTISLYEYFDIKQISDDLESKIIVSEKNRTDTDYLILKSGVEATASQELPDLLINYSGSGLFSNALYDTFKYKVSEGDLFRLDGSFTGSNDKQGSVIYGLYATDSFSSMVSFVPIAKNAVVEINNYITIPSGVAYFAISVKRGVDSYLLQYIPKNNAVATVANSLTQYGKSVFKVGDSFTHMGYYFDALHRESLTIDGGSTGIDGNGRELAYFPQMIYNNYVTQVSNADIITILGGANDYLNANVPIGTIDDLALTTTQLGNGDLAPSIYSAVKTIVNVIMGIDNTKTIVFFSQPEVGNYRGKPLNTTAPAANKIGVTMSGISSAIEDCCKHLGVAFFDTHKTLWNYQQLDVYTFDNLHPSDGIGGERLGRQMGKHINIL